MARSRRSRRTLTVIILVVLSLSLISLDLNGRTHSLTSGVKSVANDVYAPLRQGVLDIISPIGDFFAGAFNYGSVQAQNEQLQKTIGQLRAAQAEQGFEQNQLRQLTALQNLPFLQSLPTVTAQTMDEYSSNFTATITLDKGRADGVDVGYPGGRGRRPGGPGDPVVPPHLGRAASSPTASPRSASRSGREPVHRRSSTDRDPASSMTADLVPPHTPLHKGEVMFTSGLQAAAFPAGHPRGHRALVPHRRRAPARRPSRSIRRPT